MRRPKITVPLEELEQDCPDCLHQVAVHVVGGPRRTGMWDVMFDWLWQNASGACGQPVPDPDDPVNKKPCGCTARTRLQAVTG
jgi:hypothetical protein